MPNNKQLSAPWKTDVYTSPTAKGPLIVRYVDPGTASGLFDTVYTDRSQYLCETEPDIAKAHIIMQLVENCEGYGHITPSDQSCGMIAKMIYEDYGKCRFIDIDEAFKRQAKGLTKVDMKTYGQPLRYEQVALLMRSYWTYRNNELEKYRAEIRRLQTDQGLQALKKNNSNTPHQEPIKRITQSRIEELKSKIGV